MLFWIGTSWMPFSKLIVIPLRISAWVVASKPSFYKYWSTFVYLCLPRLRWSDLNNFIPWKSRWFLILGSIEIRLCILEHVTIHYVAYVKLTGELLRIWGIFPSSFDSKRCGKHAWVIRNVPRPFIECIKSYLFIGVDNVPRYRFNHSDVHSFQEGLWQFDGLWTRVSF